eukprot:3077526-Prymnesium_polylepis.1
MAYPASRPSGAPPGPRCRGVAASTSPSTRPPLAACSDREGTSGRWPDVASQVSRLGHKLAVVHARRHLVFRVDAQEPPLQLQRGDVHEASGRREEPLEDGEPSRLRNARRGGQALPALPGKVARHEGTCGELDVQLGLHGRRSLPHRRQEAAAAVSVIWGP